MALEFVVDANIMFSALLAKSTTRALIFNSQLKLHAPEYLLSELNEHLNHDKEIKEKLKQTEEETEVVIHELLHNINIIPISDYKDFVKKSIEISPDEYDSPYFAVSLLLKIPIWTNDKKLKEQDKVKVFNTKDVLDLLTQ